MKKKPKKLTKESSQDLQAQVHKLAELETALKQREEFLGVCAHDLRSPLGLVQSCLGLLLNSPEHAKSFTPFQLELLTRAERQAKQAIHLVRDLLDITSYEQGLAPEFEIVPIDALLKEFYQDYAFQAEQKGVKFHYKNEITGWRFLGDAERIRQLLQNLFSNALKFTEPGKNIYLEVSSFKGKRKTDPPYPMALINIRDEGPGIPSEALQKIFDRFKQMKSQARSEGRGLGLSVAKQISQLHDGNVWAESTLGTGATFHVLLPHVISRDIKTPLHWPPKKILVVEPNNTIREQEYKNLKEWGLEVFFAKNGIEALTFAFHHWPDCVILPTELSKIDSSDVSRMLKTDGVGGVLPMLLAIPKDAKPKTDSFVVDAILPLPLTLESWKKALEKVETSVQPRKAA